MTARLVLLLLLSFATPVDSANQDWSAKPIMSIEDFQSLPAHWVGCIMGFRAHIIPEFTGSTWVGWIHGSDRQTPDHLQRVVYLIGSDSTHAPSVDSRPLIACGVKASPRALSVQFWSIPGQK